MKRIKNSKWSRENDLAATRIWCRPFIHSFLLSIPFLCTNDCLLACVTGKKLTTNGTLLIGGVDPFKMGLEGVTYLGLGIITPLLLRQLSDF